MIHTITSPEIYQETMIAIYDLMNIGEANLTEDELAQLTAMAATAEKYEDQFLK